MKYGRLPRTFNPSVPHMSSIRQMKAFQRPQIPFEVHNEDKLPLDLGVMFNATLGDCTCAAMGHAEQVWTALARGAMVTVPDSCVLDAYEAACGYRPADGPGGASDGGGVEQSVLAWWMNTGLLQADGSRSRLLGFAEIDPRATYDICEAIYECGLVYIGFEVPRLLPENPAGALWSGGVDLGPNDGGHCVILTGYHDPVAPLFDVCSWGMPFRMDAAFAAKYVDEAYALFSDLWTSAAGKSPYGLDLATIEAQMAAIRIPPTPGG
jgi:hypothetical protein